MPNEKKSRQRIKEVEIEILDLIRSDAEFVAMCFDALTIGMSAKHKRYLYLQKLCSLSRELKETPDA